MVTTKKITQESRIDWEDSLAGPGTDDEAHELEDLPRPPANGDAHPLDGQIRSGNEIVYQGDLDIANNESEEHIFRGAKSTSSVRSFMLYTPDEERAVVRKLDLQLTLFISFLYALSFLDRSSAFHPCPAVSGTKF